MNVKRSTSNVKRLLGLPLSTFRVSRSTFNVLPLPFRALVWKEWRQLRGVYALLIVIGAAGAWLGAVWPQYYAIGACVLIVMALVCPAILSAATFAGERESRTLGFLGRMPTSMAGLVLVKVGVVFILSFTAGLVAWRAAMHLCAPASPRTAYEWTGQCLTVGLVCLVFLSVSLQICSLGTGVMATFLGTLLGGPLVVGLLLFCLEFQTDGMPSAWRRVAWAVWAMWPLLGFSLWSGVCTGLGERAAPWRTAGVALTCFALWGSAPAIVYSRGVLFGTPADYFTGAEDRRLSARLAVGRNHAAIKCWRPFWTAGTRVALVDARTVAWGWVDRWRVSDLAEPEHTGPWSPSGRRLLFRRQEGWLWPTEFGNPGSPFARGTRRDLGPGSLWVYDSETDECRRLPIDRDHIGGWFGDNTLFDMEAGAVVFTDLDTGKVSRCTTPEENGGVPLPTGLTRHPRPSPWLAPGKGVYSCSLAPAGGESGLPRILVRRHAPGLPRAKTTVIPYTWEPAVENVHFSSDGRWLLVRHCTLRSGQPRAGYIPGYPPLRTPRYSLASLDNGKVRELGLTDKLGEARFTPFGGGQILFRRKGIVQSGGTVVQIYDIAKDAWSDPLVVTETYSSFRRLLSSPSGRFLLVPSAGGHGDAWRVLDDSGAWRVFDLETREHREVWPDDGERTEAAWLGDDMILIHRPTGLWTVRRDGTGKRRLLP